MAPLNSPTEKLSEHKIKTLTNAARISGHMVKGPTIGPNSIPQPVDEALKPSFINEGRTGTTATKPTTNNKTSVASDAPQTTPPGWRYDAWRSVSPSAAERESRPTPTNLTLSDCRAIRFTMALRSTEKLQRQIVREKQQERQAVIDDLVDRLERFKIDSTAKALSAVRAATLEKEERILAAARQFDEEARIAQQQQQRELEENRRRIQERTARLRRDEEIRGYFEAIKSSKNLFIVVFEKLVKTILQNQQSLPRFGEYSVQQSSFLQRYEQLLAAVNQGQISADEVAALESLCEEMQTLQKRIDEEVNESGERLAQMMVQQQQQQQQQAAEAEALKKQQADSELQRQQSEQQQKTLELEQHKQQQEQQLRQQQQQPPSLVPTTDAVDTTTAAVATVAATAVPHQFVHPDRLAAYTSIVDFYEQYKLSVKPLQADDAMKKYRFNCQKAVNIPLNAISAVSPQHLIDKFDKLCALLAGAAVYVGDVAVSAGEHPLGVRFCSLLAAKKLINQADSIISSDPKHAFPIAAIIVAVWQRFPDMGQLCMAYLYKESPYMAPYFVPRLESQSSEEFLQSLGYRYADGQLESNEQYLKRQAGLARLYAAIVVSQTRRGQAAGAHPHGLHNGWVWLAHFMNLDPLPDICATLVHEFLVVAGADLWRAYGQQFHKLLAALYHQYLVKLSKVDKGGPRARLEGLLVRMLQEGRIDEPEGKLSEHFW